MSPLHEAAHAAVLEVDRTRRDARPHLPGGGDRAAASTVTRPPRDGRRVRVAAEASRYVGPSLVPLAAGTWLFNLALLVR